MACVLSRAQRNVLWQIAQHKYGWGYVNGLGLRSAARALERLGLLTIDSEYRCTVTSVGEIEALRRWPNSPLALRSYLMPDGGWEAVGEEVSR